MGQYYLLINIDKKQALPALSDDDSLMTLDRFSSGMKMAEQLENLGKKPMLAVALLQTSPDKPPKNPLIGSWSGDRIMLIGDECDEVPPCVTEQELAEMEQYKAGIKFSKYAWETYKQLDHLKFFDHIDELTTLFSRGKETKHVIANLDTNEYLSPKVFGNKHCLDLFAMYKGGVLKALYSCLFYSDEGFGGGDMECYRKGRWAGCHIAILEKAQLPANSKPWTNISNQVLAALKPDDSDS
ncbi:hypothetical protein BJ741DRAFT_619370, partial [Chytriomyces cf. hyalinus JEL632]